MARFRQPWRHVAARGDARDVTRVPLRVCVGQQRKRPRLTRPVAGRAVFEQYRRDLLVIRDGRLRRSREAKGATQRNRTKRWDIMEALHPATDQKLNFTDN